jgi:protein O-GlcNAc transferase
MPPPDARLAHAARLHQSKNYAAAEQAYRFILSHQPNHADALLLFGNLLHETGRHEESIQALRRGIAVSHRTLDLRRAIVGPLVALGELPQALEQAREVVRLSPASAPAQLTVAQLLGRSGDHAGAEPYARRAVELTPNSAPAWLVLARVMVHTGRPGEAMAAFDRAVTIAPAFADAAVERAYLLQSHGRLAEAIAGYEQALRVAPNSLAALNNAGTCHLLLGRPAQGVPLFEAAARLEPTDARARNNLAAAMKEAGRIDEALPHLTAAHQLDPAYAVPPSNIGSCYATVGDHARAIEAYRLAESIEPEFDGAGSNALLSMLSMDGAEPAAVRVAHVDWGRRHADPVGLSPPPVTDGRPDRRLRVGYVSPDFREHSVRHFIEPVLATHDRSAVEVSCYAAGPRRDEVTARLSKLADAWHDVGGRTAADTADLIRGHGIDVLVDLAGHTFDNRLLTFARRPAPVQVTWLGYPATTGLRAIGYRLTDAVADPPGADAFYTERLVRLPDAFFVYADDSTKPYDATLPADRNGHVTFGAFNSYSKVTPATLAAWAVTLAAVPNSRLLMKAKPLGNPSTRAAIVAAFAAAGVTEDRLDLRPWVPLAEHIDLLGSVDLMLDTFPYNGHATTLQAMWMGAPTLTRHGAEFRGRVGLSIMTQLGLPEFAIDSAERYLLRAVELATDLTRLRELRPTWRDRLRESPLCDVGRFTRGLEAAYRGMWAANDRAV